jgi:hypothetical protein
MTTKPMTFQEKLASGYYIRDAKPKPVAVVTVPVSHEFAKTVDPETVRVHGRRADGVAVMEMPKRNDIVTIRYDLVGDVNELGQPIYEERTVQSEYHPWSGLTR